MSSRAKRLLLAIMLNVVFDGNDFVCLLVECEYLDHLSYDLLDILRIYID